MEQQFVNYLQGYVRIQITGLSCERFWNLCAFHGIRIWNLLPGSFAFGDGYEACILRSDFFRLRAIVKKSHIRIRIAQRCGLPFFIHKYRRRWACVTGALAAFVFMAWLSAHIWNISIEGNVSQSDDVILEYLENEGVSHGMWRNQVDTKKLSDQIRNSFSRFSWVSAELKGTRLIIYVKEGTGLENHEKKSSDESQDRTESLSDEITDVADREKGMESEPEKSVDNIGGMDTASAIAAPKAGTVESIFVRKGLAVVSVGDEVEAGDLLVSGRIPVHNDDGEVVSWQIVTADADILLRTETNYHDELIYETIYKSYTERKKVRYALRIGKVLFSLPGEWDPFPQCDFTGEISQLMLSENYYLPVYLSKYIAREYENVPYTYSEEQAQEILNANLSCFVEKLEEKGVQIFQNNVTIDLYENSAVADGVLVTGESAVIRTEENIEKRQEEDPQE